MTLRERLANWLTGGDYSRAQEEAIRFAISADAGRRQVNALRAQNRELQNAYLQIRPGHSDGHEVAKIVERYVYKGGTVRDIALSGNRVHFPASGITAEVGPDGTLTLLDSAGAVATFERS